MTGEEFVGRPMTSEHAAVLAAARAWVRLTKHLLGNIAVPDNPDASSAFMDLHYAVRRLEQSQNRVPAREGIAE